VFLAKLEFVSNGYLVYARVRTEAIVFVKPSDYPLNPFKMKFDPPLLHPNG
jgi:hypothetical protein